MFRLFGVFSPEKIAEHESFEAQILEVRTGEATEMIRRLSVWLWNAQGLSCREAIRLSARAMDSSLALRERLKLTLHFLLCDPCRSYVRQLGRLRRWVRWMSKADDLPLEIAMPSISAQGIKRRLSSESSRPINKLSSPSPDH